MSRTVSKYVDVSASMQVIAGIYSQPSLLDEDTQYHFQEADFPEQFHRILFGSIYNLHQLGVKSITVAEIEKYLQERPTSFAIYQSNKGAEYLSKLLECTQLSAFDYYYNRMKKMTVLRVYSDVMDVSWLYDPDNILDIKKKQAQEDWLDNSSIATIIEKLEDKVQQARTQCEADMYQAASEQAGKGILDLIEQYREIPEVGIPLYGNYINAVTRGARLKKFYLRSAPSGVGKTRSMIADACNCACDELYDAEKGEWVPNGQKEETLFITTEQELSEIQTMMLAFIANVNEEHILTGMYSGDEYERVRKAGEILKNSPLYVQELSDFSLQDVENTIKQEILKHKVSYVFHDYIHSSIKILSEIASKSGVKGLREDNILFMMSVKLKDICNKYGIFLESATQLNGSYVDAEILDQNVLRGAKAIADKVDCGMIMVNVNAEDLEKIKVILSNGNFPTPNIKLSVYKNRRGRYSSVLLWGIMDKSTCRTKYLFMTDYMYELQAIEDLKITVKKRKPIDISAF